MKIVFEGKDLREVSQDMLGFLDQAGFVSSMDANPASTTPDPEAVDAQEAEEKAMIKKNKDDRKFIKKELDKLGVDYNVKCSTPTLAALLADAMEVAREEGPLEEPDAGSDDSSTTEAPSTAPEPEEDTAPPASPEADDVVGDIFGEEEAGAEVAYTKADVRDKLQALIDKNGANGMAVATTLMNDTLSVKRLADVAEESYGTLIDAINKAL